MKKGMLVLIIGLFLISFVFAGQGNGQGVQSNQQTLNSREELAIQIQNKEVKAGNYEDKNGNKFQIQEKSQGRLRIKAGNFSADCDCNITQEQSQNRTILKTWLSNGRNAEIKVMPNTASQTALNRLRLKNCVEERGCTIELKEVGQEDEAKLAYELKTQRQSKILGLFKAQMQVQAQVNAETGEIIRTKKPWWAFLAAESEE